VHALRSQGWRSIDPADNPVRNLAAQKRRVPLPGPLEIGDISPLPAQEAAIFDPLYRASDVDIGPLAVVGHDDTC
jgi:hypothetical protein